MFTISSERSNKLVVNRSKFLGFVFYCNNEVSRENILKEIKSNHPSATHICYAHTFFLNDQIKSFSTDDREPSGTAGIPILNALRENEMINTLCIVVRYFGGVKLGTQNLTKAYKDCATEVIAGDNKLVEQKTRCLFNCTYDTFNILNKKLKSMSSAKSTFSNDISVEVMLSDEEIEIAKSIISNIKTKEKSYC